MLRLLSILLIFALSLSAMSDKETLYRANSFINSSNRNHQFRAYNDFKNLYIHSLLHKNTSLKYDALVGIVKSGHKLHIDVSSYEKILRHTKHKSSYRKPIIKKHQNIKKKRVVKSLYKLKSIRWKDSHLQLLFDKKLHNNQINYFTLYDSKRKTYKYVFDIHASMQTDFQMLRKKGIKRIEIAQHNETTLRLVIENNYKIKLHFKKENRALIINILNMKKVTPKKVTPRKPIYKKTKHSVKVPKRVKRKRKRIVIDPGHGGKDPGATGYRGYREKIVVLQIAQKLKKILRKRGYIVYMTRDSDRFIKLRNRTGFANRKKADLFISIHANAVGKKAAKRAHGLECYFLDKSRSSRAKRVSANENKADLKDMNYYGKESFLNTLNTHNIVAANKLAIDLQRSALGLLDKHYKNVKDSGVRAGPFWVLVGAQMPAVLVEVGFITNPAEAKRLVNSRYQQNMALGLANGVERYFLNN